MRDKRHVLGIVPLVVLAVVATACSSSKSATDAASGSSSPGSPISGSSTSGSPVLIGELTPTSGQGFNYPDWLAGAEAAAREINASGGIKGRPVKIVECDDRNDPNQATACARQLVQEKVVAVAGGASLFGNTSVPILNAGHVPWVGDFPQTDPEYNSANMFLIDTGNIQAGAGPVAALKAAGVTKIFAAHLGIAQGTAIFNSVKQAASAEGIPVVGDVSFPITATDMSSYVQQAINSGADGVTFGGTQQQQVAFFKTARQLGAKFTMGVVDGSLTVEQYKDIGNLKTVVDGSVPPVSAGLSHPTQFPGVAQFIKDMTAEFSGGNANADPAKTSLHALVAWLSVKMIAQIAATLPAVDAQSVLNGLQSAKDLQTGVIGTWTPGAAGPTGYSRVANPDLWLSRIDGNGVAQLIQTDPIHISELGYK